jgi:hypothetical protein
MPYLRMLRPGAACLVIFMILLVPTGAGAAVRANVRVLATDGAVLAAQYQITDTVNVKTDPGATCFGFGTGGSGNTVTVPGPTALGIVWDAAQTNARLQPVSVTDAFSFGLGICGFGNAKASGNASWYLKVNHVGAQVGGDKYPLKTGDQVLWYLSPSYPYPSELALDAPARAIAGQPFTVRVTAYDDAGTQTLVAGASVTGADLPTGPDGTTTVQLNQPSRVQTLFANHAPDIPVFSELCVGQTAAECPKRRIKRIVGTRGPDRILGTSGPDRILARAGTDRVNVRGGSVDRVNCGTGRDRVVLGRRDSERLCEKVIRP